MAYLVCADGIGLTCDGLVAKFYIKDWQITLDRLALDFMALDLQCVGSGMRKDLW